MNGRVKKNETRKILEISKKPFVDIDFTAELLHADTYKVSGMKSSLQIWNENEEIAILGSLEQPMLQKNTSHK